MDYPEGEVHVLLFKGMKRFFEFVRFYFDDRYLLRLIFLIAISAMLVISTNYYTIKIMSSMRAYIYGESLYSKGEKDAAHNLILYLNTKDESYYQYFLENIAIPKGDSLARVKLQSGAPSSEVRSGFLKGMNHPDDIDDMIWLFQNFQNTFFMKVPILNWEKGDSLIYQKFILGKRIKQFIESKTLEEDTKNSLLKEVIENSKQLTVNERAFSQSLGETSRKVGLYLLVFNVVFTILIFVNANAYASHIFLKLKNRNVELLETNQELDKFVYSASHDLRAPISSLKGLVNIAKLEQDPQTLQEYFSLMQKTLDKQDLFIKDIIDFSRNKKLAVVKELVNLDQLIDDAINEHSYMPNALQIKIQKDYGLQTIQSDSKRLSIIMNNLISNAIKYCDPNKRVNTLTIKTYGIKQSACLEVSDNGVGIDMKYQSQVFDMFFVATNNPKGTGLGLYITKETVDKLGGSIVMTSEINRGTRFVILLPNATMDEA